MPSPVVEFQDVSKRYRIGGSHYRSLREDLVRAGGALGRVAGRLIGKSIVGPAGRSAFWALRGVSWQVAPGERVGIIGPNGAGKTTALRLMGRITTATKGKVSVRGKVGALIAVGAGIHPELSGRENIFLYGSIMGLKRDEIRQRFDQIVSFSGVEEFLDTPVKYYSSGMRVRLGFAVAVNVNPDVMLVDEVLAVGDFDFQRRCVDRIEEMGRSGCTIVFVSHDLNSVRQLCPRSIFLDHGEVAYDGDSQEAINVYLNSVREGRTGKGGATPTGRGVRWGSFEATIEQVRLLDRHGSVTEEFRSGESLTVEIRYQATQRVTTPEFGIDIHRNDNLMVFGAHASSSGFRMPEIYGDGVVRAVLDRIDLSSGTYKIGVSLSHKNGLSHYDFHDSAYEFKVRSQGRDVGIMAIPIHWEMASLREAR